MLSATDVFFSYKETPVIASLSLHCDRGEIVAVVGRSGSGKSTLLHLLCGYLSPMSGVITIGNQTPSAAVHAQRIGYVFQQPTLVPWLTVCQNVALALRLHRQQRGGEASAERIQAALAAAHILDAAPLLPAQLSGGMQMRTALARSIVTSPALLLLDEPMSALDDMVKEPLYVDLQEIVRSTGAASVLVTHNLLEAALLSDRVYVLKAPGIATPSQVVHVEEIGLPRPRTIRNLHHPEVLAARDRIAEALR